MFDLALNTFIFWATPLWCAAAPRFLRRWRVLRLSRLLMLFWIWGVMLTFSGVATTIYPAMALTPAAASESGYISAYDRAPTDATIATRQQWGQLPFDLSPYAALVAVRDCRRIGETAVLETVEGQFTVLVFDCAGIEDGGLAWMIRGNFIAEVDWYTWQNHPEIVHSYATIHFNQAMTPTKQMRQVISAVENPTPWYRPGTVYRMLDNYPHGAGRWPGRDYLTDCQTPLYNPFPHGAEVVRVGFDDYAGPYGRGNSYVLLSDGGTDLIFMHGHYFVKAGDWLEPLQQFGVVGNVGNSSECHDHVSVRVGGILIDPAAFYLK